MVSLADQAALTLHHLAARMNPCLFKTAKCCKFFSKL